MYELFASFLDLKRKIDLKIESEGMGSEYSHFDHYVILLDEADLGFHPQWKKKFVSLINRGLPKIFEEKKLQIIFTTHDPLTLSDIPKQNIIYLRKDKDSGLTKILSEEDKVHMKSFGANIHDLLSDSFFIDDGLIGDFAKSKIKEVIDWINDNEKISDSKKESEKFKTELEKYQKTIEIIDDKIIRLKLAEMISELISKDDFYNKVIDDEIEFLKNKKK
ncbi:MAG: ATP-binding protein [Flavobacteriales bacterium]|jgi:predicted ATP-binding protein involved in virulence|nr:ATP-binding protein [Flavobacteriales bacterium]